MSVVLVLTSYASISQTSNKDCTCIPNADLRNAAKLIEQGKLDHDEVLASRERIQLQQRQLLERSDIIHDMQVQRGVLDLKIQNMQFMLTNDSTIQKELTGVNKDLTRRLKTQKWKTRLVALIGIVATGLSFYLK